MNTAGPNPTQSALPLGYPTMTPVENPPVTEAIVTLGYD
ncbi:hypothetical protein HD594_001432 [Microbacterium thalassium]|uniref:Uncharacterized protein n=1 Tax=Microbacterium thalassium TaxID=362649 RepID=A0A7X0FP49_9MICO|nr:hypothetical protein [Microbacterium thalassium]